MYKSQLVDAVAEKHWKVSKKDVENIVDTLFNIRFFTAKLVYCF